MSDTTTDPADFRAAKRELRNAYETAKAEFIGPQFPGKRPPRTVTMWLASPE